MAYMALYRKWRPDEFGEVKGQEHIITTIKNQIKHDRVGHAYLFCGTRGTGKTTVAKLLAKAVNCESPVEGSPCGVCASCEAIKAGNSLNVIEIDAASNNGVDNIRQINESVQYSPTQGKKLVYIIDEVHMLSTSAFNALLKTLEEPPEYVMFILATTESYKIPITISSRCQKYDFHRISLDTISERLMELLGREGISATKEAVDYVAKAGDGSMRDALSILDQCIAFNLGQELTLDRVINSIGAVNIDIFARLMRYVAEDNAADALGIVDEVVYQGRNLNQFIGDLIYFIRNVLFVKLSERILSTLELTTENKQVVLDLSKQFDEEELLRYIRVLQDTSVRMKDSGTRRVSLEMGIIRLLKPEMTAGSKDAAARIAHLERELEELKKNPIVVTGTAGAVEKVAAEEPKKLSPNQVADNIKEAYPEATREEIEELIKNWNVDILPNLSDLTKKYLKQTHILPGESLSTLMVVCPKNGGLGYDYISKVKATIEADIRDIVKKDIKIEVICKDEEGGSNVNLNLGMDINNINFSIDVEE